MHVHLVSNASSHKPAAPRATDLASRFLLSLLLTMVMTLSACGGSKSSSGEPNLLPPGAPLATGIPPANTLPNTASLKSQIAELERSGALPALDRSTSITGPDTNSNGIRDDIEAYINALPLTGVQKRASLQKAKTLQNTLTVDLADKAELQKVGDLLMASTKCLGDVFEPDMAAMSAMSGTIEAMTANTKERTKRYLAYNGARSGSVTRRPDGDTCEK